MNLNIFPIKKDKSMLCANACLKTLKLCYDLKKFNNFDLDQPIYWISEIALILNKVGLNIKTYCYDSNLYNDYKDNKENSEIMDQFDGFSKLYQLERDIGNVIELNISEVVLKNHLLQGPMIICISSAIWNNDKNLTGGHFALILNIENDKCLVANPKQGVVELEHKSIRQVLESMISFGAWRIVCNI